MRMKPSLFVILLFLACCCLCFSCSEPSSDDAVMPDGDVDHEKDPDEEVQDPVCRQGDLVCDPDDDSKVLICSNDGYAWMPYRTCDPSYVCHEGDCVEETDGDWDFDWLDFEWPDYDFEQEFDWDGLCEKFCTRTTDCSYDPRDLWITYYTCQEECSPYAHAPIAFYCLSFDTCEEFHSCLDKWYFVEPYVEECIEQCDRMHLCGITYDEFLNDMLEYPCYYDCDWIGPDYVIVNCAQNNDDCSGLRDCLPLEEYVDGDEDEEWEIPEEEVIEWEGPPSLENCWHHAEMSLVDGRFCMDRFEATGWENADCSGAIYGQEEDDYPEGFQDCVDCVDDGFCESMLDCWNELWAPQTTPVYACSKRGYVPSRNITWYQANKACENSGKSLCEYTDWTLACSGPNGLNYPYGDEYVEDACWDSGYSNWLPGPGMTGMRFQCVSEYGIYDQSGNVKEWLNDVDENRYRAFAGASWMTTGDSDGLLCNDPLEYSSWKDPDNYQSSLGFRCCLYPSED